MFGTQSWEFQKSRVAVLALSARHILLELTRGTSHVYIYFSIGLYRCMCFVKLEKKYKWK